MTDREFENYLTLLSGLLCLDGKQRAAIAEELRSHLEDRLEELIDRGVSRDEAIKQALAEFGDAAGLAGQFVAISQSRKRRWLMRMTTFSMAAMVLVAASLTIFWPGRNAAPGVAAVVAQAPQKADVRDPFGPPAPANAAAAAAEPFADPKPANPKPAALPKASERPSAARRIESELDKTTDIDMVEMPLKDVVQYLQERHQIPIVLNQKKLEEASVSIDTPVTKSLKGIRLASALNLMLRDLELTYVVRDEVLQITTPEDAASMTEVRVYDCRDLLTMKTPEIKLDAAEPEGAMPGGFGSRGRDRSSEHDRRAQQLISIITTNVFPRSWHGNVVNGVEVSASGAISEYNGLIVVSQTAHTHQEIEHVLNMLRQAAGLEEAMGRVVR
jgi:hypothetical protein